jgi:hypothetical protein
MLREFGVWRRGVNFINVLRAAFTHADITSVKKTVKSSSFFELMGSAMGKAACRTLVKLTPGRRRRKIKMEDLSTKPPNEAVSTKTPTHFIFSPHFPPSFAPARVQHFSGTFG